MASSTNSQQNNNTETTSYDFPIGPPTIEEHLINIGWLKDEASVLVAEGQNMRMPKKIADYLAQYQVQVSINPMRVYYRFQVANIRREISAKKKIPLRNVHLSKKHNQEARRKMREKREKDLKKMNNYDIDHIDLVNQEKFVRKEIERYRSPQHLVIHTHDYDFSFQCTYHTDDKAVHDSEDLKFVFDAQCGETFRDVTHRHTTVYDWELVSVANLTPKMYHILSTIDWSTEINWINDKFWKKVQALELLYSKTNWAKVDPHRLKYTWERARFIRADVKTRKYNLPGLPDIQEALLLIAGIESNPGPPFMIKGQDMRIIPNGEKTSFIMPNGFELKVKSEQFTCLNDNYTFHLTEEQIENIQNPEFKTTISKNGDLNVKVSKYTQISQPTVFSNHVDFKPSLRLRVFWTNQIQNKLGASNILEVIEKTEGHFIKVSNFWLVPKQSIKFRFSKQNFDRPTPELYHRVMGSVSKQEMKSGQVAEMAALLTTVQMHYTMQENDYADIFATWTMLFDNNVTQLCENKGYQFSKKQIWSQVWDLEIVIPCFDVPFKDFLRTPIMSKNLEFTIGYESLHNLTSNRMKDVDFEKDDIDELVEKFKSGLLSTYSESIKMIDFHSSKFRGTVRQTKPELTEPERFVEYLVRMRFLIVDNYECLKRSIEFSRDNLSEKFTRKILKKLSKYRFDSFYNPGLYRLYHSEIKTIPKMTAETNLQKLEFIDDHLQQERRIAAIAQSEFFAWCALFGYPTQNTAFSNIEEIISISRSRRSQIKMAMSDVEPTTSKSSKTPLRKDDDEETDSEEDDYFDDEDSDDESYFTKVVNKVKLPFKLAKNFTKNVYKASTKLANIDQILKDEKDEMLKSFADVGMSKTVASIATANFGTLKDSFSSIKNMIDSWFSDIMTKISNIFGFEYKQQICATKLFFYYIMWVHTDSYLVKYMIIADIAVELGVGDLLLRLLRKLYKGFKGLFHEPCVSDEAFEKHLQKYETPTSQLQAQNEIKLAEEKLRIKKEAKKQKKDKDQVNVEDEGYLSYIVSMLTTCSPAVLATVTVAIAAIIGLPKLRDSKKEIGERVSDAGRSISFAVLGLTAIPKLYGCLMNVFDYLKDHAMKLVDEEHKTKKEVMQEFQDWLDRTLYVKGSSEKVFVRDINACMDFVENYARMKTLKEKMHIIRDNVALTTEVSRRMALVGSLNGIVMSSIRTMIGQQEIFHTCLYSTQPGVGKTDLGINTLQVLYETMIDEENKLAISQGLPPRDAGLAPIYNMNDLIKFNDNYFHQPCAYIDEEAVFKTTEPDSIIGKMMLLSGFPCLSNQASLEDKGRIFELKMMVTNTNNPFIEYDGMLKPEALWRRRNLFEVKVNPKYGKKVGEQYKPDEDKIKAFGIDRTKGEHLLITHMDPTNKQRVPLHPNTTDMTVPQFVKLLTFLMRRHYQVETKRILEKNKTTALLRLQYDRLISEIDNVVTRDKNKQLEFSITQIQKIKECYLPKNEDTPTLKRQKDRMMKRLKDFEEVAKHSDEDYDGIFDTKENATYFPGGEKAAYYTVEKEDVGSEVYCKLAVSNHRRIFKPGKVDFNKFKIVKRGNVEEVVYTGTGEATNIGYYLLILAGSFNKAHFLKELEILKKQDRRKSFAQKFKESFSVIHYRTMNAARETASWLMRQMYDFMTESAWVALITMGAIGIMFVVLRSIGMILNPTPAMYDNKGGKGKLFHSMPNPKVAYKVESSHLETTIGQQATYRVKLQDRYNGIMIGVRGSVFLVNKHFADLIDKNMELKVYDPKLVGTDYKTYNVGRKDVRMIPNADAALIFVEGFRPVRDILKHFVTEYDLGDDMMNFKYGQCNTLLLRKTDAGHDWKATGYVEYMSSPYYNRNINYPHDRVIHYYTDEKVQLGDSGSLTFHDNPKVPNKIIGIFLAIEGPNWGYTGVVTQEMIKKAMSTFPLDNIIQTATADLKPLPEDHKLRPVFKYDDELYEGPYGNLGVSKSSGFRRSPIHGIFPVESQPAIQDERDSRIPEDARHFLEVSLNKTNGEEEPSFTYKEEQFMIKFLENVYVTYVPGLTTVRLYSVTQAITGIQSMGSNQMNTKTSAGLPYKMNKGVVGKSPYISFDENLKCWRIQEIVHHEVDYYRNMYMNGQVPLNFKNEFRKKELVAESKITNPKTRTVATGNFIHLIIYNQLFKDLFTLLKNTWEYGKATPFALGVDPERHWHLIVEHLKYLDYMADIDVKSWEKKVDERLLRMNIKARVGVMEKAFASRGEKLPEEVKTIAYAMAVDFTDTNVCFEDMCYRKRSGLLSGHPGTFMENSEIHEMILALCVYRILLKRRPDWCRIDLIQEHVRSIKAADDIVIAISPAFRTVVTIQRLVEEYNKLGFEITAADKGSEIRPKTIHEVQFLKSKFKQAPDGTFHCDPNESIIYQLMNWIREDSSLSREDQFKTNVENAFRFAFWKGEDFYEELRSDFNKAAIRFHYGWTYSFEEMHSFMRQHLIETEEEVQRLNPYGRIDQEEIIDFGDD